MSKLRTVESLKASCRVTASGCWEWARYCTKEGYGRVRFNGVQMAAHRLSWHLAFRMEIPHGALICHRCDNPPCINPAHLFVGTPRTNILDMLAKGRERWAEGELSGHAKLTDEIVHDIRQRVHGGESQCDLADEYGVTRGAMSMLVARKTWKHLPDVRRGAAKPRIKNHKTQHTFVCMECGAEATRATNAKFCSSACVQRYRRKQFPEQYREYERRRNR